MLQPVNASLLHFIERTERILRGSDETIYKMENTLALLTFNGYNVDIIKPTYRYRADDAIIIKVNEKGIPTQALKIHPDRWNTAQRMYNDLEGLSYLAQLGLAAKVNWTKAIPTTKHKLPIRVVFYDYIEGATLDKLIERDKIRLWAVWESKLEIAGYSTHASYEDLVCAKNGHGIHAVLTDFNKITKVESS